MEEKEASEAKQLRREESLLIKRKEGGRDGETVHEGGRCHPQGGACWHLCTEERCEFGDCHKNKWLNESCSWYQMWVTYCSAKGSHVLEYESGAGGRGG